MSYPFELATQLIPNEQQKTTLWMGELEAWQDEAYIQQLWFNLNEKVIVKVIRDKITGASAGYAFVDFGNAVSARRAMSLYNGALMPNSSKPFKLNWASGGGLIDRKEDRQPEFSIFVGDLSSEITEHNLLTIFQSRYLSCKSAKIMTDPRTGMTRGYGFVRFADHLDQQRALIEMQGYFIGSRAIRVSVATPKSKTQVQQTQQVQQQNSIQHVSQQVQHQIQPSVQHQQVQHHLPQLVQQQQQHSLLQMQQQQQQLHLLQLQQQRISNFNNLPPTTVSTPSSSLLTSPNKSPLLSNSMSLMNDIHNTTVFVGGLSAPISEDELRQYFQHFGEIVYVKIPPGKGCGFVQYVSRVSAELAIQQMNGYQIGNSRIRLSWGRSQNEKSIMSPPLQPQLMQRIQSPLFNNTNSIYNTNNSNNNNNNNPNVLFPDIYSIQPKMSNANNLMNHDYHQQYQPTSFDLKYLSSHSLLDSNDNDLFNSVTRSLLNNNQDSTKSVDWRLKQIYAQ